MPLLDSVLAEAEEQSRLLAEAVGTIRRELQLTRLQASTHLQEKQQLQVCLWWRRLTLVSRRALC